jgi:hypothetical protein
MIPKIVHTAPEAIQFPKLLESVAMEHVSIFPLARSVLHQNYLALVTLVSGRVVIALIFGTCHRLTRWDGVQLYD